MNDSKEGFCLYCGKKYKKRCYQQRYCSKECQYKAKRARENAANREERKLSVTPRECPMCGKIFVPTKGQQKYCSLSCGQRMNNLRSKHRKKSNNKLLIEVTNDADSLGITYGEYMKSLYKSNGRYV